MSTKEELKTAMKAAMRAGDKERLATIRLANAAIKQAEVDAQTDINEDDVVAILSRMIKQRRESIKQYNDAGRAELAADEEKEIVILQDFLPEQASEEEIDQLVVAAIADTGAESVRDMGKVMGIIRPKLAGRADMSVVSASIKARLG